MNKYPDMQAVMISCEQRHVARELTIPQFEAIGIPVFVSLSPCNPAGPLQNCIASVHALHHAYEEGKDCLFLEDDLDIDPELFTFALERAIAADAVTYFYLHDKPGHMEAFYGRDLANRIMLKKPIRRDLYEIKHQRHMYGSQAVYIPFWFHKVFLKSGMLQATQGSFDVFLSRHVVTRNHQALVALPHPVQHRHDRTARVGMGAENKFSESFGLDWFAEGENEAVTGNVTKLDFCAENHYALERLFPLWRALPWAHKGTFFIPPSALGKTPLGGTVAPVGSMPDSGNPLVVFDARSVWDGSMQRYPTRRTITVGGNDASIPYRLHGFPHLRFADYGQNQESLGEVGFVFTKAKVLADSCRFLLDIARSVLAISDGAGTASGGVATELGGNGAASGSAVGGTDGSVAVRGVGRGGLLPDLDDRHGQGNHVHDTQLDVVEPDDHHQRGSIPAGQRPVHEQLTSRHVVGSAGDRTYNDAESWFRKHGIATSRDSLWVLRGVNVVASDSEFVLMEATALGKKTVMMDSAGVWAVRPNAVPLVEPEVIVNKILEAAVNE